MASKVNTKFVMFLVLALGAAGMLVGGLYVLNVRYNAERAIRRGDAAYEKGDMVAARDFYARAVHKEQGNLTFLKKLEDATVQIRPRSAEEANELYGSYLSILNHGVRHDGLNAQRHLRLLNELLEVCRRGNAGWDMLNKAGTDMWERLPESDPQRPLAKVYRGISVFRGPAAPVEQDYFNAEADLEAAVQALPDNDLAWSALTHARMILWEKMKFEWGRTGVVLDEQQAKIEQTLQQAIAAVENGPELARVNLLHLLMKQRENAASVSEAQIRDAADAVATLLTPEVSPALIFESVVLFTLVPGDGMQRAIALSERHIQSHPQDLDLQLNMASLYLNNNELSPAEAAAQRVMESEPLPVCFVARLQPELRKRAAGMRVEIKCREWSAEAAQERSALGSAIDQAREKLVQLVTDKVNDPVLLRADARIAYTRSDYARAARLFENLVRETGFEQDPETLYYAAVSLQRIQQYGRALERVEQALTIRRDAAPLLVLKARLELIMGRKSEAAMSLAQLPESERASDEVKQLIKIINDTQAATGAGLDSGGVGLDPLAAAIDRAQALASKGDIDGARATLLAALEKSPNNMLLLLRLAGIEIRAGQMDKAREYVDRCSALEGAAHNAELTQLRTLLDHSDPIDAMRAFYQQVVTDETERTLSMVENLILLSNQQKAAIARFEQMQTKDPANASVAEDLTKARSLLERATTELGTWRAQAEKVAPDHPRLFEVQLNEALQAKDWGAGGAVERLLTKARAQDLDQAGGFYFKGRVELARGIELARERKAQESRAQFQEAARSLELATERIGFNALAWSALAFAYQQIGKPVEAARAYEQAYKCNPANFDVVRSYVDHLRRRGDQERAVSVLREARRLWPNDMYFRNVHMQLQEEVAGPGGRGAILNARRAIFAEYPNDLINAGELARLLSSTQPSLATILDSAGRPLYTEGRWTRMAPEEREQAIRQARTQWDQQIEAIVNTLTQLSGSDSIDVVKIRANLMRERGEVDQGEALLRQFIEGQGDNVTTAMLIELSRYQAACSHYRKAVETLEKALPLQDSTQREVDQELALLYMRLNTFADALRHFDSALTGTLDRANQLRAVECLIKITLMGGESRLEEAAKRLQAIMREGGEDQLSLLLHANIVEAQGDELWSKGDSASAARKYSELRDVLNRAQAIDPASPTPRLLLAQFLLRDFKRHGRTAALEEAMNTLADVEKSRADIPEVSLMRVAIHKERGDRDAAIGELRRFVDRNPDHHQSRADLARLYVDNGQLDGAMAAIEEGIRRNPTLSVWFDVQGDLLKMARSDPAAVHASYRKAFDLAPSVNSLWKLADAALAVKSPDCRGLVSLIASRPDDLANAPGLREMYARALKCAQRKDEAIEQMRQAYTARKEAIAKGELPAAEITPWFHTMWQLFASAERPGEVDVSAAEQLVHEICGTSLNTHELRAMGRLFMSSGDASMSRTIDYQRQAIAACPAEDIKFKASLHTELAGMYYAIRRLQDAIDAYLAVLAFDPDHIEALNNCAYLYADEVNEPAKAVPMVDRLVRLAGHDAAVLDTAGWAYFRAGDVEKAYQTLMSSYRTRKSLVAVVHLAEVLVARGGPADLIDAQQFVEEGLRMNPDPDSKKKLETIAADIRQKRGR